MKRMVKGHYELIAAALNSVAPGYEATYDGRWTAVQHASDCHALAEALASQDAQFNRRLFLEQCGVVQL